MNIQAIYNKNLTFFEVKIRDILYLHAVLLKIQAKNLKSKHILSSFGH